MPARGLGKKDADTGGIACYHRILKLPGVKDSQKIADPLFKAAEAGAEAIFLPLAHPRFHDDEAYPTTLVEYDHLLRTNPRTVLVYDTLCLPNDGQAGKHPINAPSIDRLIDFWRMVHHDRIIDRMQLIARLVEALQLEPA